ncbi:conserved hypothetical protein [Frankia canadensis]|uniref:Uncharacterized protein n=1 Tax=Frankia canadensis TaxID=1836972 RepID=A0A2I2KQQ2_9ACTN|nr:conserved hypothetical protein [Frankia canadensis]SOU55284.1 conserved hypothetical protein [Frankia canadensis]
MGIRMWCELASAGPMASFRRDPHNAAGGEGGAGGGRAVANGPLGPVLAPAPGVVPDPTSAPGLVPRPAALQGYRDAGSGLSFTVHEFAELSDGLEVTLLDDRGWGMSRRGGTPDEILAELTVEEIARMVYMVLLPDWADVDHPLPPHLAAVEGSGGAQDWDLLVERLRAFGVVSTPAELMRIPRRLDLGDHLRASLATPAE